MEESGNAIKKKREETLMLFKVETRNNRKVNASKVVSKEGPFKILFNDKNVSRFLMCKTVLKTFLKKTSK